MLQDLDDTLIELLNRELPPDLVQQINFSFSSPDKDSISKETTKSLVINLFLYDVRANLELRNSVPTFERETNGKATIRLPSARVDCSYLITAWSIQNANPREEHLILGEVMKVLLRFPKLPIEVLQGSLKTQSLPLPTAFMRAGQLQNVGAFWQAMGGKPKATLNYTVTIAVPVDQEGAEVPLVQSNQITLEFLANKSE
jgi:hypothetical protein